MKTMDEIIQAFYQELEIWVDDMGIYISNEDLIDINKIAKVLDKIAIERDIQL